MDDGTFTSRSGGKKIRRSEGPSAVLRWDALGMVQLRRYNYGIFVVANCCYPVELLMTCLSSAQSA